jgi:glycerate kinase
MPDMRALLAFDKFKDAISAHDACAAAAAALADLHPTWELDLCPLTDGGEGFAKILTEGANGVMHSARVTGPLGQPVSAAFGLVRLANIPTAAQQRLALPTHIRPDAPVAIIEMAAPSGLALLAKEERDPWKTSSVGTGELMQLAVSAGAHAILLGIGGSATNDLGLGTLQALGLSFVSEAAEPVASPVPESWHRIERIQGTVSPVFPPVRVACDVTNPLLGPNGCAAIYGPQKGLRSDDLAKIEESSRRMARMLCAHCVATEAMMAVAGAGAAGGIAFGLMVAAQASLLSGFALTSDWLDLPNRIQLADVVLTGEGRFDESSAQGKGPGAIVHLAAAAQRDIHVFAGHIPDGVAAPAHLHRITPPGWKLDDALRATSELLRTAVKNHLSR